MKTFTLDLNEQQLTIIMQALADGKYRISAPVIEYLAEQINKQQSSTFESDNKE